MNRTIYIERVLTDLSHGCAPQAREVTAALEELRRIQLADARQRGRERVERKHPNPWLYEA